MSYMNYFHCTQSWQILEIVRQVPEFVCCLQELPNVKAFFEDPRLSVLL